MRALCSHLTQKRIRGVLEVVRSETSRIIQKKNSFGLFGLFLKIDYFQRHLFSLKKLGLLVNSY